jgi:hypothetical protein
MGIKIAKILEYKKSSKGKEEFEFHKFTDDYISIFSYTFHSILVIPFFIQNTFISILVILIILFINFIFLPYVSLFLTTIDKLVKQYISNEPTTNNP